MECEKAPNSILTIDGFFLSKSTKSGTQNTKLAIFRKCKPNIILCSDIYLEPTKRIP